MRSAIPLRQDFKAFVKERNILKTTLLGPALAAGPVVAEVSEESPNYVPQPATEAAGNTLGMAVLSVSVLARCNDYRGAGVKAIEKVSAGICDIQFDRTVRTSTVVASRGGFEGFVAGAGYSLKTTYGPGANTTTPSASPATTPWTIRSTRPCVLPSIAGDNAGLPGSGAADVVRRALRNGSSDSA